MKEKYAYVNFLNSKYPYIYKCGIDLKVGNIVEAPTYNYAIKEDAVVVKVKNLAVKDLPIEKSKILTITKILPRKEYLLKHDNIFFMREYIKNKKTQKWKFDYESDWVKVWKSSYGGEISHEKDCVFTASLGDIMADDYFQEYTITSHKDFKVKLKYAKILLDELYYKKIDEKEFRKLFSRL